MRRQRILRNALAGSASLVALTAGLHSAAAQTDGQSAGSSDTVIVTATRREANVQNIPFNIQAIGGSAIEQRGILNLGEAVQEIPGFHLVDQGPRAGDHIVVRGLNVDPIGANEGLGNSGGGTVATYIGEVPVYIDLKLEDIDRVEFLIGPQGTLYGSGTLAGAVRYIPRKPSFNGFTVDLRSDTYKYDSASGISTTEGVTINLPFGEALAFRASIDRVDDTGFIDYNYLVNEIGVSNPDPDFNDPTDVAANLHRDSDANTEQGWSGHGALRWQPVDGIEATLTYYAQHQFIGGRQSVGHFLTHFPVPVGKYESAMRVPEPNHRNNELWSLELKADLGFAELTSATGLANYTEDGHRDQTDLLIALEYSYEAFPTFTAFTTEHESDRTITQEFRLVSQNEGPFSWIAGAFWSDFTTDASSKEFTPGYSEFLGGTLRPDALEYIAVTRTDLTEAALYGEVSYEITPKWTVTAGARYFYYNSDTAIATDIPLFNTFLGDEGPNEITLDFGRDITSKYGLLYKFNTSYHITNDVMVYFTDSQGYRVGGSNNLPLCVPPITNQTICALPDEFAFTADKTTNYELGAKTSWMDGRLILNGDIFYEDWQDPHVLAVTVHGLQPITKNGNGAQTYGVELNANARVTDNLTVRASFDFTKAELTDESPNLISTIVPPGFQSTTVRLPGESGDRLPGSPETHGSLFVDYNIPMGQWDIDLTYGFTAVGDVLTRTGDKGDGYTLPSYTKSDIAASLNNDRFTVQLYVDNLFNEYIQTGTRDTPLFNQVVFDINSDPHYARRFFVDVAPPRVIGLRMRLRFSD